MRCRHCGRRIQPSAGSYYTDREGWYSCEQRPQYEGIVNHQPTVDPEAEIPLAATPPEVVPSVNEGRLNANVGMRCARCQRLISAGEGSHRRRSASGEVYVRHNAECERPRPRISGNTWTMSTPRYYTYGTTTTGGTTYWTQ